MTLCIYIILILIYQTTAIGASALTELDKQGEQLNNVEGNLNEINADMKKADKTLTGMEKWFGLFTCPWNRYDSIDLTKISLTKTTY